MTSSDDYNIQSIYKCFVIKRLTVMTRDDLLLIHIEPSLSGKPYKLPTESIDKIIIACHLSGQSLFPITKWPTHVYVLAPLISELENIQELKENECKLIAWAAIYQTESAAINSHR